MSDAEKAAGEILVALSGERALVRVLGRGDLVNAAALQRFGDLALSRDAGLLVLDGSRCEAMDSTFLGTIVGLASRFRRVGGRACAVGLSPRLSKTFHTLGVDRVLEVCAPADLPNGFPESEVPGPAGGAESAADPTELSRRVLEAHETLAALSDENRAEFRDVIGFLRRELEEKPG
jgi:anti-anti-sigma factor